MHALAQSPSETKPEFEVTSVKANTSGSPRVFKNPFVFSPGRFTATNVTLEDILLVAYNNTRSQIQGGPNWIDSERFDVVAVGEIQPGKMLPMIQNLLADRFSLLVHHDTKEVPAYALLVGKGRNKLQPAKEGEVTSHTPDPRYFLHTFQRMSMPTFTMFLSSLLHQPVVDRTELEGFFDFKLDLTRDPSQFSRPANGGAPVAPIDLLTDVVLRALPEQLGLRLQMQKAVIETIVIDRAERPTEN